MSHFETWASNMLRSNAVIIDTETTGLDATAQIIQIAIIDMQGKALFNSLLKPSCQLHPMSTATHGMTLRHLVGAPKITDVIDRIKDAMMGKTVLIYNAFFDTRILRQTLEAFSLDTEWLKQVDFQCVMKTYAESLGTTKNAKLEGGDHTALGDCLATLALLRRMAGPEVKTGEKMYTPSQLAYLTLKKTLKTVRDDRHLMYKETKLHDEKTGEIDDALNALDLLAATIRDLKNGTATPEVAQAKLLG
jgi:DNA polymerase-3 subunit epsilon